MPLAVNDSRTAVQALSAGEGKTSTVRLPPRCSGDFELLKYAFVSTQPCQFPMMKG
jgi:hypothetical protein